jgi:hypothetical protein
VEVDGSLVAGFDDPQEWRGADPTDPRRIFSFSELPDPRGAVERASRQLLRWFDALPQEPDVVLVHQNGLAQVLARTLHARGYDRALTILTGHDHRQHVTSYGPITVVDAGSVGAGGVYGVGKDFVGLGELHLASGNLEAADLIAVEPVSGAAEASRVVIGVCTDPSGVCKRYPRAHEAARPQPGER